MRFIVKNSKYNILNLGRKLGYMPRGTIGQEIEFIKPLLGRAYPRFHLYTKKGKEKNIFSFNLHLDQKKPSYQGSRAHSGEHEGPLIENEIARIKKILEE